MAGMLYANPGKNFVGHNAVYQFVNADGANPGTACGQCAIATVLASRGKLPKAVSSLKTIEKSHPANLMGGEWGTLPGQIEDALDAYKIKRWHATGREGLVSGLKGKGVAIALIQNTAGLGGVFGTRHWFVVFGADDKNIHVTNYHTTSIPWREFEGLWSGSITGMSERVIMC